MEQERSSYQQEKIEFDNSSDECSDFCVRQGRRFYDAILKFLFSSLKVVCFSHIILAMKHLRVTKRL